ncbi:MAG TPA: hypothetical protein VGO58_06330 [Chitinophagaceae bacterium]|jgi:hypothetical protein|nr:hypothetical protein [Chitinophagaceae bacterium]
MKRKILITALAFFFIAAAPVPLPVEYITIAGHTYGLDRSPSCLKDPSCLRGASRVAKEAVLAATGQMETATKEVKTAEKKIGDHVAEVSNYVQDAGRVATSWTNFVIDKMQPHNADALNQRAANLAAAAAIEEFNGRLPEQQSAGEMVRLNKELQATLDWAGVVNTRVEKFTHEGIPILEEKLKLVKKQQELMQENARLKAKLLEARFREGEAYKQLLKCAEYARDINEMLNKNSMQGSDLIELNDADATLKNKSSSMFGEGNNHTGSVLARPGSSAVPNGSYSTESYRARAERLINALPPQQRSAVAELKKSGSDKTPKTDVPSPTTDRSVSPGVVERFKNWIRKQ